MGFKFYGEPRRHMHIETALPILNIRKGFEVRPPKYRLGSQAAALETRDSLRSMGLSRRAREECLL